MRDPKNFYETVEFICREDKRYSPDSYEFVMQALGVTQKKINRQGHLSGRELLEGIKDYSIEQFGPMAKTVLNHWGVYTTQDFGNIVFNMVDKGLLSKTESDSREDFRDVYDFDAIFGSILRDSIKNMNSL